MAGRTAFEKISAECSRLSCENEALKEQLLSEEQFVQNFVQKVPGFAPWIKAWVKDALVDVENLNQESLKEAKQHSRDLAEDNYTLADRNIELAMKNQELKEEIRALERKIKKMEDR